MYKILRNSPMIPSFNLKETGAFFIEVLGFSPVMESDSYAIYSKDQHSIHILQAGQHIGQMEFYLELVQLDDLWNAIQFKVKNLKHKAPFGRDYGMREIHLEIPFTNTLLFIGQQIQIK